MLRCIAVDDEHNGRMLLEEYASQLPFLKMVATCKNAFEALKILDEQPIDLLFLDIQMPEMLGVDLLKILKVRPMAIFVTAYDQYAVESYELEVVDYLVKPYTMERFMKAAYRAYEIHHQKTPTLDYFFINANYALHKVKFADILYIEGLKDYVQIYIEGQKRPLISKNTLKSIEQKLPTRDFERVHRSYIVNLARIDKIKGNKLYLGNTEIPISEHSIEALLKTVGYER